MNTSYSYRSAFNPYEKSPGSVTPSNTFALSWDEMQRDQQRMNAANQRRLEVQQSIDRYKTSQSAMSHGGYSSSSSSSSSNSSDYSYYVSEASHEQRKRNIKSAPAMCKPYEDRLFALIERKYIELKAEHDRFRADFLERNPGQEMACKPLMDRERSILGISMKPADRDKWYSIIGGEYLRSLKCTDDGRKIGLGYGGHVDVYSSMDGQTEYKLSQRCGSECCECRKNFFKTKLSKYYVFSVRSPLYENGKNKRAPLSNNVNPGAPNFTIVNGQMVRTQPMFEPLPPNLRTWSFESNIRSNLNYDSIDGIFTNDKTREIYRK